MDMPVIDAGAWFGGCVALLIAALGVAGSLGALKQEVHDLSRRILLIERRMGLNGKTEGKIR